MKQLSQTPPRRDSCTVHLWILTHLLAKAMADSPGLLFMGGRYHTLHTMAHEVIMHRT